MALFLSITGAEEEVDSQGRVELVELNRKPVQSVVGQSPIEAWGQVLIRLGMLDEIMFDQAYDALKKSREESFKEAKQRIQGGHQQGGKREGTDSGAASPIQAAMSEGDREEKKDNESLEFELAEGAEPPTPEEIQLRAKVKSLISELSRSAEDDRQSSVMLASARVQRQGPLFCNPFTGDEQSKAQQISWLTTAIRREKMRMGSTGNKRKVVTAVDLLERNDTFYNPETEKLIEGLPGSEYCSSYVFQMFRTGGPVGNRNWVHEAKLKGRKQARTK